MNAAEPLVMDTLLMRTLLIADIFQMLRFQVPIFLSTWHVFAIDNLYKRENVHLAILTPLLKSYYHKMLTSSCSDLEIPTTSLLVYYLISNI